jgi:hypothetical chaperone protein
MGYYAIDFGTSNSLLSYVSDQGKIQAIPLEKDGANILRSLLFTPSKGKWYFGKDAIDKYVEYEGEGRFFRSLKKFLPEPNYSGTEVHNKKMKINELISVFLREMKMRADKFLDKEIESVVLGRPALYSKDKSNDALAEKRMLEAAKSAGFKNISFCPEPLAAGLDYKSDTSDSKIVLMADFGGGTSDFTLMKFHQGAYSKDDILGLSGVFLAGDAIDGVTMKKFISPHFGSKFEYKLPFGNNILRFPKLLLEKLCSPAYITHLRERDTWEYLKEIQKNSIDEDSKHQIEQLFTLVECQLGFPIFDEIEKTKIKLTNPDIEKIDFRFDYPGIKILEVINRDNYFEEVSITIDKIMESMKEVFSQSNLNPNDVDEICLTGGTSQFPLIKDYFSKEFGEEKVLKREVYQSVVGGLALYAKEMQGV